MTVSRGGVAPQEPARGTPAESWASVAWTRRVAVGVGVLMTLGLIALHLESHRYAGPLWRDEVNSVNLATMPSFADVFANMHYDSFPVAWLTVLHTWAAVGLGETDAALRRLGLLIGLATVVVLWWTAWRLGIGPPLVTLLLFGMSPTTIIYGDAVRGYGLAVLGIVWCFGALWAFTQRPTRTGLLIAQTAALFAVQTHYANCILLAAIGAGAAAACLRPRNWRVLLAILGLGTVAALSLLIDVKALIYMTHTGPLERGDWSLTWLVRVFAHALAPGVPRLALLWLLASVLAAGGLGLGWWSPPMTTDRDHAVYVAVTLAAAFVGSFVALNWAGLPTQYWHYLSLMALTALGCDVGICLLAERFRGGEWIRIAAVALAALVVAAGVLETVPLRMTNLDLVAKKVEEAATVEDLIVVFPWQCGITFQRYYRGPAAWITLPDFEEHKVHRHLLVAEKMQRGAAAVAPELERVEQTLRRGGAVWVVGVPAAPNRGPFGPHREPHGTRAGPYLENWELQLGALLETHVQHGAEVPLPEHGRVNAWENLPLFRVEGWR